MRQTKTFIKDFFCFYFTVISEFLLMATEICTCILKTLATFTDNIIKPNIIEFFTDICFISLIVYQSFLSVTSNCCLGFSKFFYCISKITHDKSEELINKNWY
jgi:hypothetical protein